MSSPEVIYVCRWLIRDTFRQALANRVFWVMLVANALAILFCLSIGIEEVEPLRIDNDPAIVQIGVRDDPKLATRPHGYLTLVFGLWRLSLFRGGQEMVHYITLVLGEGVFGIFGTFLALVLTAGFMPEFLQPGNATVLLSKPAPRWVLLLGKYLGVMALLAFHVGLFVFGTWLALGLRTGFWVNGYLWGMPLLLLQVAAFYGFSAFLGVLTGSTLVCVIGSVLFWSMCWGMNYGRHQMVASASELPPQHFILRGLTEAGYWILPKPLDLGGILNAAVESGHDIPLLKEVQDLGAFHPEWSILTSLAFAAAMIVLAAQQLASKDY
jgi:ABC-type transport system involved in multi-copper enzyme maturation permease subunit